jgi:hypothetical protein
MSDCLPVLTIIVHAFVFHHLFFAVLTFANVPSGQQQYVPYQPPIRALNIPPEHIKESSRLHGRMHPFATFGSSAVGRSVALNARFIVPLGRSMCLMG